jgi:hypothetical protein
MPPTRQSNTRKNIVGHEDGVRDAHDGWVPSRCCCRVPGPVDHIAVARAIGLASHPTYLKTSEQDADGRSPTAPASNARRHAVPTEQQHPRKRVGDENVPFQIMQADRRSPGANMRLNHNAVEGFDAVDFAQQHACAEQHPVIIPGRRRRW